MVKWGQLHNIWGSSRGKGMYLSMTFVLLTFGYTHQYSSDDVVDKIWGQPHNILGVLRKRDSLSMTFVLVTFGYTHH